MNKLQKDLKWAIQAALTEQVHSKKGVLTESKQVIAKKFIKESTYEQLLNLVFNPNHKVKVIESGVIESSVLKKMKSLVTEIGTTTYSDFQGDSIETAVPHSVQWTSPKVSPAAVGGTMLALGAVAIAALGYFLYKRFFSKAARACTDSKNRDMCIKQFKIKAIQTTIAGLQKSIANCAKAKNPEKCKMNYMRQIQKWNIRLQKASQG